LKIKFTIARKIYDNELFFISLGSDIIDVNVNLDRVSLLLEDSS